MSDLLRDALYRAAVDQLKRDAEMKLFAELLTLAPACPLPPPPVPSRRPRKASSERTH